MWWTAAVATKPVVRLRRGRKTTVGRRADDLRLQLGRQIVQLQNDAGISQRALAAAAGIPQPYVSRIARGQADPSIGVLIALADVLGSELGVRLYPGTGPRIHDRWQAPIIEELIRRSRLAWRTLVEVPVWRPARGVIDVVLARPGETIVAVEVHSQIPRLEQQLRWSASKAQSLPSCEAWSMLTASEPAVAVSRLLVLRSTRTNREIAIQYESTLRAAYPARTADAVAALSDPGEPWPGDAVIWADVASAGTRLLSRPPRGVLLGR
jgi:transcriptional regulator with XRE-family HTH domain